MFHSINTDYTNIKKSNFIYCFIYVDIPKQKVKKVKKVKKML